MGTDLNQKLEALFARLSAKPTAHNALMAIDAPDHGVSWRGAPAHLSIDTPFCIASCTKLLVTALIFQLVDTGAFDLEMSAANLLPQGMMTGLHSVGGRDYSDAITVRHLLTNTSELPDYFEDKPKGQTSFLDDILAGRDTGWTSADALERARMLAALCTRHTGQGTLCGHQFSAAWPNP